MRHKSVYNIETWKHCPYIESKIKIVFFIDDFKTEMRLIILLSCMYSILYIFRIIVLP